MTPAPRHWSAWSPHRPWCSPLPGGQSRRCQTSQTQWRSPGLGCCHSVGFPWSPPLKRCPLWQWWLEQSGEARVLRQYSQWHVLYLDMLRRKTPYRLNMVCVRCDYFPLLLSLSSVWPTVNRTNGKYSWAKKCRCFPYRFWMHSLNSTHQTDQLHDSHVHLEKTHSKKGRQAPWKYPQLSHMFIITRSIFLIVTPIGEGLGW